MLYTKRAEYETCINTLKINELNHVKHKSNEDDLYKYKYNIVYIHSSVSTVLAKLRELLWLPTYTKPSCNFL